LESLVKLAKKKKDEGLKSINLTKVEGPPTVYRINIHKNSHNKTLHLLVKLNNNLLEGLVDIGASMLIMSTTVVHELGIVHLVIKFEAYKTTSRVVNQALGKITDFLVRFGDV
jgi:predicted aspartyl protease